MRHVVGPIMPRAHEDREALFAGRVEVDHEAETPPFGAGQSQRILERTDIVKGELGAAMVGTDVIVAGTYRTGHQEHVYVEPNGVIAVPEEGAPRCTA